MYSHGTRIKQVTSHMKFVFSQRRGREERRICREWPVPTGPYRPLAVLTGQSWKSGDDTRHECGGVKHLD